MFANGHHIFATLASAPLESRAAACLPSLLSTCMANWLRSATSAASTSSSPPIAAAVALVAIHTVVHISVDVLVVEIVRVITPMAAGALENRVVIRIRVAGCTNSIRVAMVDRKLRVLRVIERGVQPVGGAMAVLARGREELGLCGMSRIRRVVVVGLVAADARRWQRSVVAVDVAVDARPRWNGMRSGQRERRFVVIEGRVRPLDRVMAELARRREARVRHWAVRIVEIGLMARYA